jgi:hypothetical protein
MRPRTFAAVCAALVMLAGGLVTVTARPAAAACTYHDYPAVNPRDVDTGQLDPYIWIKIRRQASSAGPCRYYAVAFNKRATGRDGCEFYVTFLDNTVRFPCPREGQRQDSGLYPADSQTPLYASMIYGYYDESDAFPIGTYRADTRAP